MKTATFTDDKLKQLKEDLENPERTMILDEHDMRAIVARLEAADKIIHCYSRKSYPLLWKTWLKACGK